MRFDFTDPEPVAEEQLRAIEELVNAEIRANLPVTTNVMDLEAARKSGAIAPFEEKYGSRVRVVTMGGDGDYFSREFCGGTHVSRTGDIGEFVIVGESSVASGIRRIEGRAGGAAHATIERERRILHQLSRRLSVQPEAIEERLAAMQEEIKGLRRQAEEARAAQARQQTAQAAEAGRIVNGVKFIHQALDGADHNMLAQAWDGLKGKLPAKAVGLLYSVVEGKVNMVVGVTDDIAGKTVKAGDLLNAACALLGGKGGGRPNLARGGGNDAGRIDEAIEAAAAALEKALA
jgi:alanyl-tRNA synthetase